MAEKHVPSPKAILFDIGGVCVLSPFAAIDLYEANNSYPPLFISKTISSLSPNGAWQCLERGEIPLDASFFERFSAELNSPDAWQGYWETRGVTAIPPQPRNKIDGETLFWEMMTCSRTPDPYMFPALRKLRASGRFILGALSNTVIFPPFHAYSESNLPPGDAHVELHDLFDVFISSAHEGMRKPETRMYKFALQKLNGLAREKFGEDLKPHEVLFLDDIGENLKAAREAGMQTLKVKIGETKEAVEDLEKITGLMLDAGSKYKSKL